VGSQAHDLLKHGTIVGRLDIHLLRALVAVSEAPTFSSCARQLNLPQPTLSLQLKRLEERAGRQLFKRDGRGKCPALTRHGVRLAHYARSILALYDEAILGLSVPDLTGEVKIGMPEWFADSGLNNVLSGLKSLHDNVQIKLVAAPSNQLREHIKRGTLDVAICILGLDLESQGPVWNEPLHWVCGRDKRCLDKEFLPVGLFSKPCPFRNHITAHLDKLSRKWREEFVSDSVATIRTAVASGLAVTALPVGAVTDEIQVIDNIAGFAPLPPVELSIYRSSRSISSPEQNQLVEHMSDFIAKRMAEYNRPTSAPSLVPQYEAMS